MNQLLFQAIIQDVRNISADSASLWFCGEDSGIALGIPTDLSDSGFAFTTTESYSYETERPPSSNGYLFNDLHLSSRLI
mgnify:CR=1 FL=1